MAAPACVGTETGNPSFEGSLGYDAYSSESNVALRASALTGAGADPAPDPNAGRANIAVAATWLVLGEVSLLRDTDCAATTTASSVEIRALGAGDHVGTQAPPTKFPLRSGEFCGARLPLELGAKNPDAPAQLEGHSLLVRGTLADGRSFELLSAASLEVSLRGDHAFGLNPEHAGVLIGFDLAHWLDGLPWEDAEAGPEGAVIADDHRNSELLRAFEARIAGGIGLFRDANRDGLLDDASELLAHAQHD